VEIKIKNEFERVDPKPLNTQAKLAILRSLDFGYSCQTYNFKNFRF